MRQITRRLVGRGPTVGYNNLRGKPADIIFLCAVCNAAIIKNASNYLRGFAKLKKFKNPKKNWIELNPPTHPPIQFFFFGNPSVTWPEHSNHNFE